MNDWNNRSAALGRAAAWVALTLSALALWPLAHARDGNETDSLDVPLAAALRHHGFDGAVQSTLAKRLGRPIDVRLASLGRLLFFDTAPGLRGDNACAGCHAPATGMGDTQSIAIGVQNNGVVGPGRTGPRNQRRTPTVVNSAFFPKLMWNGRFAATSGDPFDNSQGFEFPAPEGTTAFPPPPNVLSVRHLLVAQAHIPPTELNEAAGFTGTRGTLGPRFDAFDDGVGGVVPAPDAAGFRNEPIRQAVLNRLNATPGYRARFAAVFAQVKDGAPVDFKMFAQAIAEFEFTLVRANAPIDRFARGDQSALTSAEKRGALLFFGKANCVACHAVAGASNQMFSDFENRNIGVPQIAPEFGVGKGNSIFDGPGENEDFGAEQVTGVSTDRYKFRTSPLRNVALQPAFFHNGAFTRLDDAIRHHLDVRESAHRYNAKRAGVAADLTRRVGPMAGVLGTLDPLVQNPTRLSATEFRDLVEFVGNGLLDPQARPEVLCRLVPKALPSGKVPLAFQGCNARR